MKLHKVLKFVQKVTGWSILVTQCCVCKTFIGIKRGFGAPAGVSHTYCPECAKKSFNCEE